MRNFLYVITLLMATSTAFAYDIPDDTPLLNLPEGSRIIVKQDISLDDCASSGCRKILYGKNSDVLYEKARKLRKGEVLPIIRSDTLSSGDLYIQWSSQPFGWISFDDDDGPLPRNIIDFNQRMGQYFQIIYGDPDLYSGLEKSMVVEIVMKKITTAIKANDYAKALTEFAFLEMLGERLPESFYYYYAETLEKTGKKVEARAHATDYLKRYGKKGKYYAQVIEMMSRL